MSQLLSQETSLQNTITQVEEQLALAVINKVDKNIYDGTSDVIAEKDRRKQNQQKRTHCLRSTDSSFPYKRNQSCSAGVDAFLGSDGDLCGLAVASPLLSRRNCRAAVCT